MALNQRREWLAPMLVVEAMLAELVRCNGRRVTIPITNGHRWIAWRILNDTGSERNARALISEWLDICVNEGYCHDLKIDIRRERNGDNTFMSFWVSALPSTPRPDPASRA